VKKTPFFEKNQPFSGGFCESVQQIFFALGWGRPAEENINTVFLNNNLFPLPTVKEST
jgi:hypothetical protein